MFHKITQKVLDTVNHNKDEVKETEHHTATERPLVSDVTTKPSSVHTTSVVTPIVTPVVAHTTIIAPKTVETVEATTFVLPTRVVSPTVGLTKTVTTVTEDVTFDTQTIVKAPIIEETIREDILVEQQLYVHRNVEKPVIHHITEHITEAPAPNLGGVLTHAPIIEEVIHTTELDEVQPVIHRELARQVIQKEERHLNERIVEPTVHTHEVRMEKAPEVILEAPRTIIEDKAAILETTVAATTHEQIKKGVIVENTIRKDVLVEVQPIVHRDIDRPIIHHIESHVVEAPAPSLAGKVINQPIVHESYHKHEMNEVQPVIHRELARQVIEKEDVHINEAIVEPTLETAEIKVQESHFATPAPSTFIVEDKPATTIETFAPVEHKSLTKNAIIDEKVRTDILIEEQPVVHRDIDQPIVHHIEQHITEAPAPSMAGLLKKAAIVQETLHTTEIDDIQTIVHRENAVQVIEKKEAHTSEHAVLPTQHLNEVVEAQATIALQKKTIVEPVLVEKTIVEPVLVEKTIVEPVLLQKTVVEPVGVSSSGKTIENVVEAELAKLAIKLFFTP